MHIWDIGVWTLFQSVPITFASQMITLFQTTTPTNDLQLNQLSQKRHTTNTPHSQFFSSFPFYLTFPSNYSDDRFFSQHVKHLIMTGNVAAILYLTANKTITKLAQPARAQGRKLCAYACPATTSGRVTSPFVTVCV